MDKSNTRNEFKADGTSKCAKYTFTKFKVIKKSLKFSKTGYSECGWQGRTFKLKFPSYIERPTLVSYIQKFGHALNELDRDSYNLSHFVYIF